MIATLFFAFFITSFFVLFPLTNKIVSKWTFYFLCLFLILFAALRDGDSVRDYAQYILMYENINEGYSILTDPTYIWISMISRSSLMLFFIYAILGVGLKLIAIKQLSELWLLSLVIYISNFYILHEMTQIRAGVAAGILLLCIKPIYERDWKRFLLFCVIAFLFHASAIIMFPLWVLGYKKSRRLLLILSIPIAYLIYFSGINLVGIVPIPGIEEKIMIYQKLQEQDIAGFAKINVFNLVFLAKIVIFYLLIWKYEVIIAYNKYAAIFMKIFCISLISFPIFAVMPVMGFRISELFGVIEIVLFPLIFYVFKPQIVSKLLVLMIGFVVLSISIFYSELIL